MSVDVPIHGASGEDLGFTIKLGPVGEPVEDDPTGLRATAARIEGWSKLVVDGETYTFSKMRALALLQRFNYIQPQLEAAPKKGVSE